MERRTLPGAKRAWRTPAGSGTLLRRHLLNFNTVHMRDGMKRVVNGRRSISEDGARS